MKVNEFLKGMYNDETGFYILDSAAGEEGKTEHEDIDYVHYSYNTKRYNKLKVGDLFIYRRPKKISKNRKFYFYGGGRVSKIEGISDDGRVRAIIELSFKLDTSLYQEDPKVEEMIWTFRKKGANWEHFWGQYGMNKINEQDFIALIGDCECVEVNKCSTVETSLDDLLSDEKDEANKDSFDKNFIININDEVLTDKIKGNTKTKRMVKGRKVDYNKQNKANKTIGDLGEIKILEMEIDFLLANGREDLAKKVEYTAEKYGDGLGYDIVSYDLDENKKFIEVKTTKNDKIDGFYITPKEISISNEKGDSYYIYRLYNVDQEKYSAELKVFRGAVKDERFDLTAVCYKVTLK